ESLPASPPGSVPHLATWVLPVVFPRRHRAAEADVRHAGVGGAAVPGAGAVAQAVRRVAQERAALLAAQGRVGLPRVAAPLGAGRVDDHPPAGPLAVQIELVPVAAPL